MPAKNPDPFEEEIESALFPALYVSEHACPSFVRRLKAVAKRIANTDPHRAIHLFQFFFASCQTRAEDIDDSSGTFGDFALELSAHWIRARQRAESDPVETVSILLAWMDDDPFCFLAKFDERAIKVFDEQGLAAFELQVRMRFETNPERQTWATLLRYVYCLRRDLDSFLALAERTTITPSDCLFIGCQMMIRRRSADALAWVERGLAIPGRSEAHHLHPLQLRLLLEAGRVDDAIEVVWRRFERSPNSDTYGGLMSFVPESKRWEWHEKAMNVTVNTQRVLDGFQLLLRHGEIDRLASLARKSTESRLLTVYPDLIEQAAQSVEKAYPPEGGKLWYVLALDILDEDSRRRSADAIHPLRRARACYEQAKMHQEWEALVKRLRAAHPRKTKFLADLAQLEKRKTNHS